jgi:hypothetical protein
LSYSPNLHRGSSAQLHIGCYKYLYHINMKTQRIAVLLFLLTLVSCKEHSSGTDTADIPSFMYITSRCLSAALSVSSSRANTTAATPDSNFTYTFKQNLILDFSAAGNCCPDSNRFVVSQEIRNDTVLVTIIDTARNLCRCMCSYMIHAQWNNLPLDSYIVRCRLGDGKTFIDPIHFVAVVRKP